LLSQIRIASMPPDPNLRSPQNQPKNLLGFLGNHHHTRWSLLEASEVLLLEAKYSGRFTGWIYRRFPPFFFLLHRNFILMFRKGKKLQSEI
jgi:hypothetical protein